MVHYFRTRTPKQNRRDQRLRASNPRMDRNWWPLKLRGRIGARTSPVLALLVLILLGTTLPVPAMALQQSVLCGNGSPPDYGFTYDLLQEHWTVNWQDHVSEGTVINVDTVLDRLNADSIAQTMILIMEEDEVGVRVNCAVHFLRYMRLGLPAGERKDNGFVFLIVVEPSGIDVHYGVGLGLPALTAPELTSINRAAEAEFASTGSMDQALRTLVREFDSVARANYAPLVLALPTREVQAQRPPEAAATPQVPELPPGPMGVLVLCAALCVLTLVVVFLLWLAYRVARAGIEIGPYGTDPFGGDGWRHGGGGPWWRGGGSWGGGRGGGSIMRGGGGSGRSGRGN